jgi:chromosome segregation ATPase
MLGFPTFPEAPLADLFQALDKFQVHLASMDTSRMSADKLEGFEEIRAFFAEKAAFLKQNLPGDLDRMRAEYNGLLAEVAAEKDKLDQEVARVRQLAEDLPAIRDKAAADAEKVRHQAEKDLQDQIAKLLAPLQKGPQELPLAEGEVLKKDILNLQSTAGLGSGPRPGSRVSGNIWENWKKPGQ